MMLSTTFCSFSIICSNLIRWLTIFLFHRLRFVLSFMPQSARSRHQSHQTSQSQANAIESKRQLASVHFVFVPSKNNIHLTLCLLRSEQNSSPHQHNDFTTTSLTTEASHPKVSSVCLWGNRRYESSTKKPHCSKTRNNSSHHAESNSFLTSLTSRYLPFSRNGCHMRRTTN